MKSGDPVTIRQVARARSLMVEGYSMVEAAVLIGVRSCDLDLMLWRYIDTDVHAVIAGTDRPTPMF